jgi:hypothetical protein
MFAAFARGLEGGDNRRFTPSQRLAMPRVVEPLGEAIADRRIQLNLVLEQILQGDHERSAVTEGEHENDPNGFEESGFEDSVDVVFQSFQGGEEH